MCADRCTNFVFNNKDNINMNTKREKNTERIAVRLNPSLLAKLQQHTIAHDINHSQLLRQLLTNYLN